MKFILFTRKLHTSIIRSNAIIIDGVKIAQSILAEVKSGVASFIQQGKIKPFLAVVLIGDDPGSAVYVKKKLQAAQKTGIDTKTYKLSSTYSQENLVRLVHKLNANEQVSGILVQRPLPKQIDEDVICWAVAPSKDVDGFHPLNMGRYCIHQPGLFPCTALAVMEILTRSGIETKGKKAVICGKSKNVGLPIALHLCKTGNASTTILDKYSDREDMKNYLKTADIVISATGVPGLITKDHVCPGSCLIDVGFTRTIDPKTGKVSIAGDCDFEGVRQVAGHLTPVPGGVGPVTVAMLMINTLRAAQNPGLLYYKNNS